MMRKRIPITVTLDSEIVDILDQAAFNTNRSRSRMIEDICRNEYYNILNDRGILEDE